jgi:hypothetical protein
MRLRQRRTDANQPEIVKALRKAGAFVQSLHAVGNGCPDVLVVRGDRMILLEIKDGSKPPSARSLTTAESDWHKLAGGHVRIVENVEQALEAIA